jgi:hypothetical protein
VKRERVPFVFTPDWAYVMGGKDSYYYNIFIEYCQKAHEILQQNFKLFVNLFSMVHFFACSFGEQEFSLSPFPTENNRVR